MPIRYLRSSAFLQFLGTLARLFTALFVLVWSAYHLTADRIVDILGSPRRAKKEILPSSHLLVADLPLGHLARQTEAHLYQTCGAYLLCHDPGRRA
jgi:hypothetical protein